MLRIVAAVFWTLRWVIFPILLMPWISAIASTGFRTRRSAPFTWKQRALTPLLLCALWMPFPPLHWRVFMSGFGRVDLDFDKTPLDKLAIPSSAQASPLRRSNTGIVWLARK